MIKAKYIVQKNGGDFREGDVFGTFYMKSIDDAFAAEKKIYDSYGIVVRLCDWN